MPLLKSRIGNGRPLNGRTLAADIKYRCQIQRQIKSTTDPNIFGRFSAAPIKDEYETICSVWCGIQRAYTTDFNKFINGVNTAEDVSHYIVIRQESVKDIGKAFSSGFNSGHKVMSDWNLSSDLFIYLETGSAEIGRRLRILGVMLDEVNREFVYLKCSEIKETGTGHGN